MNTNAPAYDVIKVRLFKDLQIAYSKYDFSQMKEFVNDIDNFLVLTLQVILKENIEKYIRGAQANKSGGRVKTIEFVDVHIANNVVMNRTLEIAFLLRHVPRIKNKFRRHTLKLEVFGRYSSIFIQYDNDLEIDIEKLDELLAVIIETVYRWMENFIASKVKSLETVLSHDLYFYVRSNFDSGDLLKRFWFVAIRDGKGYCLFDNRLALDMLTITKEVPKNLDLPPASLSANFLSNEADFDLMASKEAIQLGTCIDVPFVKTKYSHIDIEFSESEAAIHGANSISLLPLVNEGKVFLLAAFPTPHRSHFEPLIIKHAAELRAIFNARFESITELISNLRKNLDNNLIGKMGEFTGGFMKAYLNP